MECPNCREEIPDDFHVCIKCGYIVNVKPKTLIQQPTDNENLKGKNTEEKQSSNDRKKQFIFPAILIIAVAFIIGGTFYSNYHKKQIYVAKVSEANILFDEEKYAEAIGYYEDALSLNNEPSIAAKLEECKKLNTSVSSYDYAIDFLNSSNKKSAYSLESTYLSFNEVISEDAKRYQDTQVKKQEIITQLIQYSQNFYNEGAFGAASDTINWVLKMQPDNEKAKELQKPIREAWSNDIKAQADQLRAQQKEREQQEKERERQTREANNQKIVDSNGKQIWKIYIDDGSLHFTATYKGSGNFIVKLSNSNQDLIDYIANEIGDYKADKTVSVPYKGWYYLEIYCSYGSWTGQWN